MMQKSLKLLTVFIVLIFPISLCAQTPADEQAGQHFQAARQAELARDFEKAASEYREALKLRPEVAEGWFNLGIDLYALKRDDEAITAFQQALKRKPGLVGGNFFLGLAYLRMNQYQKAVGPFKKAIVENPKELKAYINLSVAYAELGEETDAAAVLEKANQVFPHNLEVLYNRGRIYTRLMEESYQEMADLNPDSYRFHQVMGDSYEVRGDYFRAQAGIPESA